MPAHCVFYLNEKDVSVLTCVGFGSFPAYSGSGDFTNRPAAAGNRNNGPLPLGLYHILDRRCGGRLGVVRDHVGDFFAGTHRQDWFALYRDDGIIDDQTSIDGIRRGAFRLHPVGFWGISKGCITLPDTHDFYRLREFLLAQSPAYVNGMRSYGTLDVR
ncbi:DUF2778 domain-containing protein [Asaia bogorensis]|uniref:DUF2778 domain-containing protein n=1 Tax=Asaia bogorensis TaxID=91915 RepID=UPI000EFB7458|nr:DUF2778 domain-containing protein [Asaia bogorensis]